MDTKISRTRKANIMFFLLVLLFSSSDTTSALSKAAATETSREPPLIPAPRSPFSAAATEPDARPQPQQPQLGYPQQQQQQQELGYPLQNQNQPISGFSNTDQPVSSLNQPLTGINQPVSSSSSLNQPFVTNNQKGLVGNNIPFLKNGISKKKICIPELLFILIVGLAFVL